MPVASRPGEAPPPVATSPNIPRQLGERRSRRIGASSLAPALGTLQRSDGPKPLFLCGCVPCNCRYQKLATEPEPIAVLLPFPSDYRGSPRELGFPQRSESKRRGQAFKTSE